MIVGCPGGNMYATGNPIAQIIAIIFTICMIIICFKILDLETKNKWYYLGIVAIIGIIIFNIITFEGWF